MWMCLSPVAYAVTALPERWQWVLALNPMTGVINGFRWALLGTPAPEPGQLAVSVAAAARVLRSPGSRTSAAPRRPFADTI